MKCSPARLAANRANAQKSTGPKTVEGKEVSRLNAFRHGMAGEGDLIGPGEDAAAVAALALEFARDYQAQGKSGHIFAHRAALLSIRLKHITERQLEAEALNIAAAQARFDAERNDWLDDEIEQFQAGGEAGRDALAMLEILPDGVLYLLDQGEIHFDQLGSADPEIVRLTTDRAERWLSLKRDPQPTGSIRERVRAELIRLDALFETMSGLIDQIVIDRTRAGTMARFDATPEAVLVHRYEAAAERGVNRALRSIMTQNRERNRQARAIDAEMDDEECAATMAAAREILGLDPETDSDLDPDPCEPMPVIPNPAPAPSPSQPTPPGPNPHGPTADATTMGSFRAGSMDRMQQILDEAYGDVEIDPRLRHLLDEGAELPITASRH